MSNARLVALWEHTLQHPEFMYQGVRKIMQDVTWSMRELPEVQFSDIYGPNKFKQLVRNYVNEEEFARVRTVLDKRRDQSFTSVAVSMRGAKKEPRSQGWCLLSIIVSRSKDTETVEVQYRSTELILKFGGDLAFLPWVFDQLNLDPDLIRFRFANCFISGVYFPYVAKFIPPVNFLEKVWRDDRKLFAQGTRFFLRSAYKQDQVFPYSPENVAHRFAWKTIGKKGMREVRDYLEEKHKTFGKPLPKLHYAKGEYVPRGQRNNTEQDE
jgi:hypothetical protein